MNRFLKRALKVLLIVLGLLMLTAGILYFSFNESLPVGTNPKDADALAQKMLIAVKNSEYESTRFLEWSFAGGRHSYKWDKENGKVEVKWSKYLVNLNLNKTNKSIVFDNGKRVIGSEKLKLISKALAYFNNDSFWLVAPFKVFDSGTTRSIVTLENGSEALLVTYKSGGTTPGDSYLWELQENGFPISFKMWVKIIPIGGLKATWNDWQVMENGVFLPVSHKIGPVTLDMGEVRAYNE